MIVPVSNSHKCLILYILYISLGPYFENKEKFWLTYVIIIHIQKNCKLRLNHNFTLWWVTYFMFVRKKLICISTWLINDFKFFLFIYIGK